LEKATAITSDGQCLKWSSSGGGAQLVMGDRATGGHEGEVVWGWGIFEFCPLKWCILCIFHAVLHTQLA